MESYSDVIQTWGRAEMVADLAPNLGVSLEPATDEEKAELQRLKDRVRKWDQLDILPVEHWQTLLEIAPSRDIDISPELLIELAARD